MAAFAPPNILTPLEEVRVNKSLEFGNDKLLTRQMFLGSILHHALQYSIVIN